MTQVVPEEDLIINSSRDFCDLLGVIDYVPDAELGHIHERVRLLQWNIPVHANAEGRLAEVDLRAKSAFSFVEKPLSRFAEVRDAQRRGDTETLAEANGFRTQCQAFVAPRCDGRGLYGRRSRSTSMGTKTPTALSITRLWSASIWRLDETTACFDRSTSETSMM
jgi:hypothetical protein